MSLSLSWSQEGGGFGCQCWCQVSFTSPPHNRPGGAVLSFISTEPNRAGDKTKSLCGSLFLLCHQGVTSPCLWVPPGAPPLAHRCLTKALPAQSQLAEAWGTGPTQVRSALSLVSHLRSPATSHPSGLGLGLASPEATAAAFLLSLGVPSSAMPSCVPWHRPWPQASSGLVALRQIFSSLIPTRIQLWKKKPSGNCRSSKVR